VRRTKLLSRDEARRIAANVAKLLTEDGAQRSLRTSFNKNSAFEQSARKADMYCFVCRSHQFR